MYDLLHIILFFVNPTLIYWMYVYTGCFRRNSKYFRWW